MKPPRPHSGCPDRTSERSPQQPRWDSAGGSRGSEVLARCRCHPPAAVPRAACGGPGPLRTLSLSCVPSDAALGWMCSLSVLPSCPGRAFPMRSLSPDTKPGPGTPKRQVFGGLPPEAEASRQGGHFGS